MKVSDLGEFGLIRLLADIVNEDKEGKDVPIDKLLIGIGDDTAAWKGDNDIQLATTDSLIQGVHFNLDTIGWEEIGYKAIAVNLSDIAAMGGIPQYCLVSLALPGATDVDNVVKLYHGMSSLAYQYGVIIAGGNVSSANELVISITVFGTLKGSVALTRSAAREGEKVAITGYTGLSAAGMRMLKEDLHFDEETTNLLRQAHCKPVPRIQEGQGLLHYGVKTAIDISDGLIADLAHICEASKVSALINENSVPVHPVLEKYFAESCYRLALTGGEDYELLFTASDDVMKRLVNKMSCPIYIIGEITGEIAGQVDVIDEEGKKLSFEQSGWKHF
jgi:thiamine-monophosphate kinase